MYNVNIFKIFHCDIIIVICAFIFSLFYPAESIAEEATCPCHERIEKCDEQSLKNPAPKKYIILNAGVSLLDNYPVSFTDSSPELALSCPFITGYFRI